MAVFYRGEIRIQKAPAPVAVPEHPAPAPVPTAPVDPLTVEITRT